MGVFGLMFNLLLDFICLPELFGGLFATYFGYSLDGFVELLFLFCDLGCLLLE